MRAFEALSLVGLLGLLGCSKGGDPVSLCAQLEQAGAAKGCAKYTPSGVAWQGASAAAEFTAPDDASKKGSVLAYTDKEKFSRAKDFVTDNKVFAGMVGSVYVKDDAMLIVRLDRGFDDAAQGKTASTLRLTPLVKAPSGAASMPTATATDSIQNPTDVPPKVDSTTLVGLTNVSATLKTAEGKFYLEVAYAVTAKQKIDADKAISLKAACAVKDQTMIDTRTAFDDFDKINAGETKKDEARPFSTEQLDAKPSKCTLTFAFGKNYQNKTHTLLGEYCYTPPTAVTPGACAK